MNIWKKCKQEDVTLVRLRRKLYELYKRTYMNRNNPIISIIAAMAENRAIGKNNKLLWSIPEDMKRFKEVTSGHPVIMGRKTYESLPERFRPLPGRTNIVISRDITYKPEGCIVVQNINESIARAVEVDNEEVFIMGGGQIYALGLPLADKLYLTIVKGEFEGDTFFPDYSAFVNVVKQEEHNNGTYIFSFVELLR